MGVPSFYRWLAARYPRIVSDCVEEESLIMSDGEVGIDTTKPNPNGVEYDNLYLDMNGIIHPCFHPEDRPAPTTESEVFTNIFDYIDRLFAIVRPRKLVYMAIDGVAPRAKMNQQRSRRFRAAQDREEMKEEEMRIREQLIKEGVKLGPAKDQTETFDSNVITPGTEFMFRLSVALQWYVHKRLNEDPGWKDVLVILSDANVPGEGEHKAMAYVREMRGRKGFNPNTRHCVYGLDADLIMLALATHEPHFSILREQVLPPAQPQGREQLQEKIKAEYAAQAAKEAAGRGAPEDEEPKPAVSRKPFQFLQVDVLREYLALDLRPFEPGFESDPERLYDDFVFLCFFVGNDFLPHMPTLEIREGGIELMLHVYKRELPRMGYLAAGADVNLARVEHFIQAIGFYEDQIFSKRAKMLERQKQRMREQRGGRSISGAAPTQAYLNQLAAQTPGQNGRTPHPPPARPWETNNNNTSSAAAAAPAPVTNRSAAEALRERLKLGAKRKAEDTPPPSTAKDAEGEVNGEGGPEGAKKLRTEAGAVKENPEAYWSRLSAIPGLGGEGPPGLGPDVAADQPMDAAAAAAAKEEEEEDVPEPTLPEEDLEEGLKEVLPSDLKAQDDAIKAKLKETLAAKVDMFDQMIEDEKRIRLGEAGWKERYYSEKMGATPATFEKIRKDLVHYYVQGLVWVMKYYYEGVPSWSWYYPFHYAPFASDLKNLASLDLRFDLGEPFKPFDQLMGVLPAASSHCLPAVFRPLFSDPKSPILDFYPKTFAVDMNGKRFAWQGVALLPFIDADRLKAETKKLEKELDELERYRNTIRLEYLYAHADHPVGRLMLAAEEAYRARTAAATATAAALSEPVALHAEQANGMTGFLLQVNGPTRPAMIHAPYHVGDDITANQVCCATYKLPPHKKHECVVPPGCIVPRYGITEADLAEEKPLWHEQGGRGPRNGGGGGGGRQYNQGGRGGGGYSQDTSLQRVHYSQGYPPQGGRGAPPPGYSYGSAPPPQYAPHPPPPGGARGGPYPPPGAAAAVAYGPPPVYGGPPPGAAYTPFGGRSGGRQSFAGRFGGGPGGPAGYGGAPPQYGYGGAAGPGMGAHVQPLPPVSINTNPYAALQPVMRGPGGGADLGSGRDPRARDPRYGGRGRGH